MLPWGHAGAGYVVYHLWLRLNGRLPPSSMAVLALLVGTQFPDLLDKPGTWIVGVLPSGRTFGHSLLTLGVVAVFVLLLLHRYPARNGRMWGAFFIGWFSHLLSDGYAIIFDTETCVRYLFWPLLTHCIYENDSTVGGWLAGFEFSSHQLIGLSVALLAVTLWWFDGRPGVQPVRDLLQRGDSKQ